MHSYAYLWTSRPHEQLVAICDEFSVELIEDGAEALGSLYHGEHVGNDPLQAFILFNGNKIVTTGGGGCITTDDEEFAENQAHNHDCKTTPRVRIFT